MALRCNGNNVEVCNAAGTMWMVQMTCTTFCQDGTCALAGLASSGRLWLRPESHPLPLHGLVNHARVRHSLP